MRVFPDRTLAARATADALADALRRHLAISERAALAVSGGTTPAPTFALLAGTALPWDRVDVTLTDERDVAVEHAASNEGMLRRTLLTDQAIKAQFIPLEDAALTAMPTPFAAHRSSLATHQGFDRKGGEGVESPSGAMGEGACRQD